MKNTLKKLILAVTLSAMTCTGAQAVRTHCAADTASAIRAVRSVAAPGAAPSTVAAALASSLVGIPYESAMRTDSTGRLQLRLDAFDEISFVNTVAALAKAATQPGSARIGDIEEALVSMSCRRGEENGFPSIMAYGADWAIDNKGRGNISELTESYSELFKTKSLDYLTRHREEFPALADSAAFDRQKMLEMGFRSHKIPYMKRQSFEWKDVMEEMADGDIVMFLGNNPEFDWVTMGFVVRKDDGFHLVYASPEQGKVVIEEMSLSRYVKKNAARIYGYRWFRLK